MPSLYQFSDGLLDIEPMEPAELEILIPEIKLPMRSGSQYAFHNIFARFFFFFFAKPERCLIFKEFTPICIKKNNFFFKKGNLKNVGEISRSTESSSVGVHAMTVLLFQVLGE